VPHLLRMADIQGPSSPPAAILCQQPAQILSQTRKRVSALGPGSPKAEEKSPAKKILAGQYELNPFHWEVFLEGDICRHKNCKYSNASNITTKKHYCCKQCAIFQSNRTDAVQRHDPYCQNKGTKGELFRKSVHMSADWMITSCTLDCPTQTLTLRVTHCQCICFLDRSLYKVRNSSYRIF
jgi:hypothetical protein